MTDCSRCGDCCDPVILTFDPQQRAAEKLSELLFVAPPWVWHQYEFLRDHWRTIDTVEVVEGDDTVTVYRVECDQFDRESRTCGAHDTRPQVCSGFPWYGREPDDDLCEPSRASLSPRCSFNADVRTMLPIVEVR